MPTRKVGPGCYQWGNQKKYCGKGAKAKADRQGRAIALARALRRKKS